MAPQRVVWWAKKMDAMLVVETELLWVVLMVGLMGVK
jgi:hypothetical protein